MVFIPYSENIWEHNLNMASNFLSQYFLLYKSGSWIMIFDILSSSNNSVKVILGIAMNS